MLLMLPCRQGQRTLVYLPRTRTLAALPLPFDSSSRPLLLRPN